MFLLQMKEENKELFIELCGHAANADEDFTEVEKELIFTYCREMNIPEALPQGKDSLDAVLKKLKAGTDDKEKRIIILELMGVMYADEDYSRQEQEMMEKVIDVLGVEKGELKNIISLFEIYKTVYRELVLAIGL